MLLLGEGDADCHARPKYYKLKTSELRLPFTSELRLVNWKKVVDNTESGVWGLGRIKEKTKLFLLNCYGGFLENRMLYGQ